MRNHISPAFLDELRARTPVVSLVGRRVKLTRAGRDWKGCCPFHNERTPSFYVYEDGFHCFGCGAHGDAITYTRRIEGLSFPAAVSHLAQEAGLEMPGGARPFDAAAKAEAEAREAAWQAQEAERRAKRDAEAAADEARRARWARDTADQGAPIAGTLAEWYLNRTRGIPTPAGGWADCLRWHSGFNALVALATLPDGTVRAIQRIHLNEEGEKLSGEDLADLGLDTPKITNGVLAGAAVRLPGDPNGPLLIAEGIETGLSAWSVTEHETWITLGTVTRADLPAGRRVIVLGEDMPRYHPVAKSLRVALARWRRAGLDVVVAMPWPKRRQDKSDFNDLLRQIGPDAVRARIDRALLSTDDAPVFRVTRDEARKVLDDAIRQFFVAARAWTPDDFADAPASAPPVRAIKVDVGGGKTHYALKHVAAELRRMRARGDTRSIVIAVPTHALGDQQATDFAAFSDAAVVVQREAEAEGLQARVWRSWQAKDPENPGRLMCLEPDAMREALAAGARDVQAACCAAKGKPKCPMFDQCSTQRQRATRADVWVVPHEVIYGRKPKELGTPAILIVDEAAWQDGLVGHRRDEAPVQLSLDSLDPRALATQLDPEHWRDLETLTRYRDAVLTVLRDAPNGPLAREAMLAAGITAHDAEIATAIEWKLYRDPEMWPNMEPKLREAAKHLTAELNGTVRRRAAFWGAVKRLLADDGPALSGHIALASEQTKDGAVRVLRLKWRKDIAKGWRVPTLLMDANFDVRLVHPYWPHAEQVADIGILTPHQRVHQVTDCAYPKSRYVEVKDVVRVTEVDRKRWAKNLRDLRAVLTREAHRVAPGKVLAVLQKAVKEALAALGPLPGNVELAHHNAIAGRNDWSDVRLLIVVGRTQPKLFAVRLAAEALTGVAVEYDDSRYERVDTLREMADGTHAPAEAERHPDPMCEAIRWQIAEGELVQILGRPRGLNRADDNPVDVLVLCDAPLPLPIASTLSASDLDASLDDLMLAEGGVAFANARHAATAYPSLWPNHAAAAKALERERTRTFPIEETLYGECPSPLGRLKQRRVTYRLAGAGQKDAVAWCDLERVPDVAAFLAEKLGPLVCCEIDEPEPEPPPDPEPPAASVDPAPAKPARRSRTSADARWTSGPSVRDPIDCAPAAPAWRPSWPA